MNKRNNVVVGMIFVALGILFLLKNLNIFNIYFDIFDIGFLISRFWPALFLILPGIFIHSSYFSGRRNDPGVLVPGGILLTSGAVCQLSTIFHMWGLLWPGFLLAVAVGLLELYLFGTRDKNLLIPVTILGGMSVVFFVLFSLRKFFHYHSSQFLIPVLLILLGVAIIYKNGSRGKDF